MASRGGGGDETRELPQEQMASGFTSISASEVELGKQIGGGGAGLIFTGRWDHRRVAVKKLFGPDEATRKEFVEELLTMSKLSHPNIVCLLGGCIKPPDQFMVMELCDTSLFDVLHHSKAGQSVFLKPAEKLGIAGDVARAGSYLHRMKPPITHRDIKSANVLLSNVGGEMVAKLCDFGLVGEKAARAGTAYAMAPELLQCEPFTKSVDVYAFAFLLWELLMQEIPFHQLDPEDIRGVVVGGNRPAVCAQDYPPSITELVQRCWAQRARDRPSFDDCLEILGTSLESLRQGSPKSHLSSLNDFDSLDMLMGGSGK
jgi:serine/threonine protein kinase